MIKVIKCRLWVNWSTCTLPYNLCRIIVVVSIYMKACATTLTCITNEVYIEENALKPSANMACCWRTFCTRSINMENSHLILFLFTVQIPMCNCSCFIRQPEGVLSAMAKQEVDDNLGVSRCESAIENWPLLYLLGNGEKSKLLPLNLYIFVKHERRHLAIGWNVILFQSSYNMVTTKAAMQTWGRLHVRG